MLESMISQPVPTRAETVAKKKINVAINGILHFIPSRAGAAEQFPLGPKS
jgi:hypothetical protein